ncbi:MAG: hypothetical protein JSV79_07245, partial [Armatimonadota bacterium]
MRYMRRTAYMVIVTILCAACMLSSDRASAQDETAGASAVPSAALEISGHWRDTSDDSEWRFVLRDPTGELLGTGSADSGGDEFADGENGDNQPAGSALLTPRSLLVDVSRPRRAGGPDTAVLELRETAVAESLGLNQGLLSLTDLISLSASSRKDVNLALGFERALPPSLRLGKKWAHFLTLSSQYQFRNPEEGKTDASLVYAAHAYWGRGWAWKAVSREGPALDSKVQAAIEAARARAEMSEQSPL